MSKQQVIGIAKGTSVTIRDRNTGRSKSMTVHGLHFKELDEKLTFFLKNLAKLRDGEAIIMKVKRDG